MTNGYKNKVEYKVQLLDDSTISCRVEVSTCILFCTMNIVYPNRLSF